MLLGWKLVTSSVNNNHAQIDVVAEGLKEQDTASTVGPRGWTAIVCLLCIRTSTLIRML
jgi:hypothetical protein